MKRLWLGDCLKVARQFPKGSLDLIYIDPPFFSRREFGEFSDTWEGSMATYLEFLRPRCTKLRHLLKPTGTFFIHLDWHAVHYAKVMLDDIFGYDNFVNEIIWCYQSGGASKRTLARKHDTILFYSKSKSYTFNVIRTPYLSGNVAGRPGFHPEGKMLQDWWNISMLSTTDSRRCGYPTQKPEELLERIITIGSNEGDTVADFFCGSGTTLVAAKKLRRKFIGVDCNPEALRITRERLSA